MSDIRHSAVICNGKLYTAGYNNRGQLGREKGKIELLTTSPFKDEVFVDLIYTEFYPMVLTQSGKVINVNLEIYLIERELPDYKDNPLPGGGVVRMTLIPGVTDDKDNVIGGVIFHCKDGSKRKLANSGRYESYYEVSPPITSVPGGGILKIIKYNQSQLILRSNEGLYISGSTDGKVFHRFAGNEIPFWTEIPVRVMSGVIDIIEIAHNAIFIQTHYGNYAIVRPFSPYTTLPRYKRYNLSAVALGRNLTIVPPTYNPANPEVGVGENYIREEYFNPLIYETVLDVPIPKIKEWLIDTGVIGVNDYIYLWNKNNLINQGTFAKSPFAFNYLRRNFAYSGGDEYYYFLVDSTLWGFGYYGGSRKFKNITSGVDRITSTLAIAYILKGGKLYTTDDGGTLKLVNLQEDRLIEYTDLRFGLVDDLSNVASVVCGRDRTFVILESGYVFACGDNSYGALGIGSKQSTQVFTQVIGLNKVIQVSCGNYYTLFLLENGDVYAAGDGNYFVFGDLGEIESTTPVKLNITEVAYISAAYANSFFVKKNGDAYGCGKNSFSALGLGHSNRVKAITKIPSLADVNKIEGGEDFAVALLNSKQVKSCGDNFRGQLGLGDNKSRDTFTLIDSLQSVENIIIAKNYVVFLLQGQLVYGTGESIDNFLGPDVVKVNHPTLISTPDNIQQVAVGTRHMVFLSNGNLFGLGTNENGELGIMDIIDNKYTVKDYIEEPSLITVPSVSRVWNWFLSKTKSLPVYVKHLGKWILAKSVHTKNGEWKKAKDIKGKANYKWGD